MIGLPPSPFLSSVESFPASTEAAGTHAHAPREVPAAINSNSAGNVMLQAGSVTAVEAAPNAAVAAPISRITHNPVTQAVEVRPVSVSPGMCCCSLPVGESDPSVRLDCAPGESTWDVNGIDCVGEIFAGAAKIDDYRFVLDEHAFLDEIEGLPLFLKSAMAQ